MTTPLNHTPRVSELIAQHEAQRQEDQLALQEKEKRIEELEEALQSRTHAEEQLEQRRKVSPWVWLLG